MCRIFLSRLAVDNLDRALAWKLVKGDPFHVSNGLAVSAAAEYGAKNPADFFTLQCNFVCMGYSLP